MILFKCLLILITVGSTYAQMSRELVITNLNYTVDTTYMNVTYWRNDSRFSAIAVSHLPIIGITVDAKLYVNTGGAKGEFTNFLNEHLDFCQFVKNPSSNQIANLLLQIVSRNKEIHIPEMKCPIAAVSYHKIWFQAVSITCFGVLRYIGHVLDQRFLSNGGKLAIYDAEYGVLHDHTGLSSCAAKTIVRGRTYGR